MDEVTEPATGATPTRRRVLGLVAAAGAGSVLVACGGGSGSGSAGTSGSGGGASSDPAGGSGGAGGKLVATADVPVGGGVVLDQQKVVVTQPDSGTFKAFSAICTHQACTVASVKDGVITCPCHGSQYSASDGSVMQGPAPRPLAPIAVTVQNGEVVEA